MDEEHKRAGSKFWIYFIPVCILVAIPLVKWTMKLNSGDMALSKEEANVFNTDEGEIRKQAKTSSDPNLNDQALTVRYRMGKPGDSDREYAAARAAADAREKAAAREAGQQASEAAQPAQAAVPPEAAKKQAGLGVQKGYLTYAVGKAMDNPGVVKALLNNKFVINGFMSRGTVKAASGSAQGLANYLKGGGPANFLNNPVVKAAMNNPAIVSAVASSGLVGAMLQTPAAQALMKDPDAIADLISSNPQLVALAMSNPATLTTLMNNPSVAGVVGKFDTSKVKAP
ncbi:MAG: hypothetical protein NTY45_06705 [Elusimicrobia bacterium]|nr:hypothetical protein [Elusimicrobiota bacterium]